MTYSQLLNFSMELHCLLVRQTIWISLSASIRSILYANWKMENGVEFCKICSKIVPCYFLQMLIQCVVRQNTQKSGGNTYHPIFRDKTKQSTDLKTKVYATWTNVPQRSWTGKDTRIESEDAYLISKAHIFVTCHLTTEKCAIMITHLSTLFQEN